MSHVRTLEKEALEITQRIEGSMNKKDPGIDFFGLANLVFRSFEKKALPQTQTIFNAYFKWAEKNEPVDKMPDLVYENLEYLCNVVDVTIDLGCRSTQAGALEYDKNKRKFAYIQSPIKDFYQNSVLPELKKLAS